MALSSVDMNILASLKHEQQTVSYANGSAKERWNLNNNEMAVVEKWFNSRIQELETKKSEN